MNFDFTVSDPGHGNTYTPWTDGHAVGFKVERDGQLLGYVYLNPSITDGFEDTPDVFLYQGTEGDPSQDPAFHYYGTEPGDFGEGVDFDPTPGAHVIERALRGQFSPQD